jgi:hypothetical protein
MFLGGLSQQNQIPSSFFVAITKLYSLISKLPQTRHLYRKRAYLETLRLATTKRAQRGTGYPS